MLPTTTTIDYEENYAGGTVTVRPQPQHSIGIEYDRIRKKYRILARSNPPRILIENYRAEALQTTSFDWLDVIQKWASNVARSSEEWHQTGISDRVAAHFSPIGEVQYIYLELIAKAFTYWVFTNELEYDSNLLDRLIDEELTLMKTFPQAHFDFHYIPLMMVSTPYDVVSRDAPIIFQRSDG